MGESGAPPPQPPKRKKRKRTQAARVVAAAIGLASAAGLAVGLNSPEKASATSEARMLPDSSVTPGAIDTQVNGSEICAKVWRAAPSGQPPVKGGTLTYSQAARATPESVKNQAYKNYGLVNPKDGGKSYEVDHLIPLSLGGRDVVQNLWPQSRTAGGYDAWVKDRLEMRLYNILCRHKDADPKLDLKEVQTALRTDWTKAYRKYCGEGDECASPDAGDQ